MKPDSGSRFWTRLPMRNELNAGSSWSASTAFYGQRNRLAKHLFSSIKLRKQFAYEYESQRPTIDRRPLSAADSSSRSETVATLHNRYTDNESFHGGIFNLTFNDDGNLLLAACERKSMLMFDARTQSLQRKVAKAHEDSVNYIRFLDSRLFASCSDDCTVALWDLRNLKHRLRRLTGHTHCVKNVEYDSSLGLLVSSSFDGNVHLWDINKYSSGHVQSGSAEVVVSAEPSALRHISSDSPQDQCPFNKALYLSCLLRMRLTHDSQKMILCTSEGYLMIVHDLDLKHLENDLRGFQSDLYRLMQKGHSSGFDFGSWLNRLFTAKRNRVELISDFPIENEAHSITSLDVHPQNWTVLSRNISRDENSEWTCVHNIQDYERPHELMSIELPKEDIFPPHTNFQRSTLRSRLPPVDSPEPSLNPNRLGNGSRLLFSEIQI
jgi:WD40 repeat protein